MNLILIEAPECAADGRALLRDGRATHIRHVLRGHPGATVRVGLLDGRFIANPTYTEMREGLLSIMVVGTANAIVMIESGAKAQSTDAPTLRTM